MFLFDLNLTDPSKNSFYFPILIILTTIILSIQLIIMYFKSNQSNLRAGQNIYIDEALELNEGHHQPVDFEYLKSSLKRRYLIVFIITRSAMWAKAPYLYILFRTVEKFSITEIGTLYFIDSFSALLFGPITGNLADRYGRKYFCDLYNKCIIVNIALLMAGSHFCIYLAQAISGFSSGIISTTFEAWIISESYREFRANRIEERKFRQKLFKSSNIYDAIINIIILIICAFVYSIFGIYAPLYISICLSLLAIILIHFFWDENELQISPGCPSFEQFKESFKELKKIDVLCIGLIEGIAITALNIFLFSWTPILKQSTSGKINEGFIYILMVLTMIIGTKLYEVLIIYLNYDYYKCITCCLFLQGILLFLIYVYDKFLERMIILTLFIGLNGFYNPLNSLIKSDIIIEKYRALIMNYFRVPLNLYTIIILKTLRHINSFNVVIFAGSMCFLASSIGLFLIIYYKFFFIEPRDDLILDILQFS